MTHRNDCRFSRRGSARDHRPFRTDPGGIFLPRGWVSAIDLEGRTIWIVDAHGYGKRFIVRADEILTAFIELQRAIHKFAVNWFDKKARFFQTRRR